MNLHEFCNALRSHADEIDELVTRLVVPSQERFSIPDAFAKLRLICGGDVHIAIRPPEINSYSYKPVLTAEPWVVYIGAPKSMPDVIGNHEGTTLDEAVDKAIAAYRAVTDPKANEVDATQAIEQITEEFSVSPRPAGAILAVR